MKCRHCTYFDYDFFSNSYEIVLEDCHFCGLHGRARVDPDEPQKNLDSRGGCGFRLKHIPVQLELF